MSSLVTWMDRTFYPDVQGNWDDRLFRSRILDALRPEYVILDVGAGAGIVEQMNFRGAVSRVCGVDLDPRVVDNKMLDEGRVADAGRIPYDDATFDLVFADNVMEHIAEPEAVLNEVRRILKPGGMFFFKTPNRTHYMPLVARFTPHWFHQYVNRLRGRDAADTFPTLYRVNCKSDVTRLAEQAGLAIESIERIESRPEYLRLTALTYVFGLIYERFVNSTAILAPFRIVLIAITRKLA